MTTTTAAPAPTVERITCDDVQVGDRIAKTKTGEFQEVVHITEGAAARRLFFTYSQESRLPAARRRVGKWWGINIRPQRTTQLWREVQAAPEEAPLVAGAGEIGPTEQVEVREIEEGDLVLCGSKFREVLLVEVLGQSLARFIRLSVSRQEAGALYMDLLPDLTLTRRKIDALDAAEGQGRR